MLALLKPALLQPPLWRIILALIGASIAIAVATFVLNPITGIIWILFFWGTIWFFFAPLYVILRRDVAVSIIGVLNVGVAAALMASLVFIAYRDSTDIYFSTTAGAIRIIF